jgi:hypothetical protein
MTEGRGPRPVPPAGASAATTDTTATENAAQTEGGAGRWLPYVLGAAALLGLLAFLSARSKRTGQVIAAAKGGETRSPAAGDDTSSQRRR